MTRALASALALIAACGCSPPERAPHAQPAAAEPPAHTVARPVSPAAPGAAAAAPGAQQFGAPIDPATPELTLATLLQSPAAHAGKTIRTRGTIHRVCQKMGCWIELKDQGAPSAVRVPMAGHAFFLPQSVAGKRAAVQGTVSVAALSEAHKRHLQAEGAEATDVDVSIAATGVSVQ